MRVVRQCKGCGGMTSHITDDLPDLPRVLAALLRPVAWLFDRVVDPPPPCLFCRERGDLGDDT